MERIKILEVGPGNFGKGGMSVATWNWYKNFDYKRIQADFISIAKPDNKYIEYINEHNGSFYYVNCSNKIIRQFRKYNLIYKLAKSNHYNCVHIHVGNAFTALFSYIVVYRFCGNVFIHSREAGRRGNNSINVVNILEIVKYLLHRMCRPFIIGDKITCLGCSELAVKWMFPRQVIERKQYIVIKNGIEVSNFVFNAQVRNKMRDILNLKENFVIGHIGRFVYQKNHNFLIDIFYEVYKRNNKAILLLAGEGKLEKQVKDRVANLGLNDNVIFYGTTSKVNELYQVMDCFVFPSHNEGFGTVCIEAQAAGLKVLCSDKIPKETQITELIDYLSLSSAPLKWANKILSYDNKYERKDMSEEIKKAGYDIHQSAKELEQLYFSCTNNN